MTAKDEFLVLFTAKLNEDALFRTVFRRAVYESGMSTSGLREDPAAGLANLFAGMSE